MPTLRYSRSMTTKPKPMKRVHFYLNDPLHKQINAKAKKSGLPVADHLRRAVEAYLLATQEAK